MYEHTILTAGVIRSSKIKHVMCFGWELTPLTLHSWLILLKQFTLLAPSLYMNTFYFDCLGDQELKNMAHNRLWQPFAVTWSDGTD